MADTEERFVSKETVSLKFSVHILQVLHMLTVGDSADIDIYNPAPAIHVPTSDCQYQQLHAQSFVAALLN